MPHGFLWFNETMLISMTPINRWLADKWFYGYVDAFVDKLLTGFAYGLKGLSILKFNNDRSRFTIARAGVLWDEATARGYKMENAELFGKQLDFYRVQLPGKKLHFSGLPRPYTGGKSLTWLDDKAILKGKLLEAGVAVPKGGAFTSWSDVEKIFGTLKKPLIVKPRLGSRGRHTTTNIFTLEQLKEAFKVGKQVCHWVMVEEMLQGSVYRGTVIGGKLVGVLGGSPGQVVGDGVHTISELIEIKNTSRDSRIAAVVVTQELKNFIGRQQYTLESVLPKDVRVDLGSRVGLAYGGTSFEITGIIHPGIKAELEKAAAVVDDAIIGFDFIVPDPAKDPATQHWGIIEANGLPFLQLHHFPLYGEPNNVAKHVWDLFDRLPWQNRIIML